MQRRCYECGLTFNPSDYEPDDDPVDCCQRCQDQMEAHGAWMMSSCITHKIPLGYCPCEGWDSLNEANRCSHPLEAFELPVKGPRGIRKIGDQVMISFGAPGCGGLLYEVVEMRDGIPYGVIQEIN